MRKPKILVGIDEVGRGAIAGPLIVVGAVGILNRRNRKILNGIKDSKKLTPLKRKIWLEKLKKSDLKFYTAIFSNKFIDRFGIRKSLEKGVKEILKKIKVKPHLVLLDGGLKAPPEYRQRVIVKGDEKIPLIAAASIFGKVKRDRIMSRLEKKYPYGFAKNKGYGTEEHFFLIKKMGISQIHRQSFLKNLLAKKTMIA